MCAGKYTEEKLKLCRQTFTKKAAGVGTAGAPGKRYWPGGGKKTRALPIKGADVEGGGPKTNNGGQLLVCERMTPGFDRRGTSLTPEKKEKNSANAIEMKKVA